MSDLPGESSPQLQPLGYARADMDRRGPRLTPLGIVSICLACLSLAWNGIGEIASIARIQMALNAPAIFQGQQQMAQTTTTQMQQPATAIQAASEGMKFRRLTPDEIAGVIAFINSELQKRGAVLNEAQSEGMTKLLSQDGQKLIDPAVPLGSKTPGQLQMIMALPSGYHSILLAVNHGSGFAIYRTRFDSAGNQTPYPVAPQQPQFTPTPMLMTPQIQQMFRRRYVEGWISACTFGIGALAAIVLLFGGVRLLQFNLQGIRLHWIYVAAKLAIGAAAVIAWIVISQSNNYWNVDFDMVFALVGCVYPICLIFILPRLKF